jgi:hypothetical protein
MRLFAVLLLAAVSVFPQAVPRLTTASAINGPGQANALTNPLTAKKTRVTYSIGSAGGFRIKLEERGTFARNSIGDEATHLKVIRDGQAVPGSSVVSQRKEGVSYLINDANPGTQWCHGFRHRQMRQTANQRFPCPTRRP